jgi:basic membrane protein A
MRQLMRFGATAAAAVGGAARWRVGAGRPGSRLARAGRLTHVRSFRLVPAFVVVGSLLLAACTGGGSDEVAVPDAAVSDAAFIDQNGEGCASGELLCVGLVLAPGELATSLGTEALADAADDLAHTEVVETSDMAEYRLALESLEDQSFDLIFARPGPDVDGAIRAVNAVANGSGSWFVLVGESNTAEMANVAGLVFNERRVAFLAGAAAGLLTNTGVVAAVLPTDLDKTTVRYKEGWERGVRFTNPEASFLTNYHPGALDVSFDDALWSVDATRRAIEGGADVVFGAGGLTGNAALVEAARQNGEVYCIGVEADRWEQITESRPCVVTSALLLVDEAMAQIISDFEAGEAPVGEIEGDVALAPFRDDEMSDDIAGQLDEILAGIEAGVIIISED